MHDTERLLRAAREGDRASLDALLDRHRGRLHAFLRARMDPALARAVPPEDVLQETLIEAARKVAAFEDRGPASFYRWLVAIARFKAAEADRARRALKRAAVGPLEDDPPGRGTSPSEGALRHERAERLRGALEAIPPDQAEAVRLRYLEGLSVAETADRMARSEASVKALVSRGLDALAGKVSGPA
jgi:RNA polymerase sigma-70 factor (ECF subfamily)